MEKRKFFAYVPTEVYMEIHHMALDQGLTGSAMLLQIFEEWKECKRSHATPPTPTLPHDDVS
jgi:hypothetical protein